MLDEADALEVRRELAWQFNLLPSLYCHESWLPRGLSDAQLHSRLQPDGACHRYLSPWLLARFKLAESLVFDFDAPASRLALLDGAALERLAPAVALFLHRDALCRTLEGAVLAKVRSICGLEQVGFVITNGAVSPRAAPVAAATAALDDALAERLPAIGRGLLMALAGGHDAVGRRVRLKFDRNDRVRPDTLDAATRSALGALVVHQLIPRLASQWAWLFC